MTNIILNASRSGTSFGAAVLAWGAASGCAGPPEDFRPYDNFVTCGGPYLETQELDDVTARLDLDGDGLVTPDDLLPGETVFALRMLGTHVDAGSPPRPGVSLHVDWNAHVEQVGSGWILHATADCNPTARLALSFAPMEPRSGESFEATVSEFEFRVVDLDLVTMDAKVTDGTVTGRASEGELSGLLDGSARGALHSEVPERYREKYRLSEITGQSIQIEALIFRDVVVLR